MSPCAPAPPSGHSAVLAAAGGLPNTGKAAAWSGPGQFVDLWPRLPQGGEEDRSQGS